MRMGLAGEWPTFGVEYRHDGKDYVLHLVAADEDDARRRLRSIGIGGQVLGELVGSVEMHPNVPASSPTWRLRWELVKAALSPRLNRAG